MDRTRLIAIAHKQRQDREKKPVLHAEDEFQLLRTLCTSMETTFPHERRRLQQLPRSWATGGEATSISAWPELPIPQCHLWAARARKPHALSKSRSGVMESTCARNPSLHLLFRWIERYTYVIVLVNRSPAYGCPYLSRLPNKHPPNRFPDLSA